MSSEKLGVMVAWAGSVPSLRWESADRENGVPTRRASGREVC